jgi:hypothetical protein
MHDRTANPTLTMFRLCQEFGWTPDQVRAQPAADIEAFIAILQENDRLGRLIPADDHATTILISPD